MTTCPADSFTSHPPADPIDQFQGIVVTWLALQVALQVATCLLAAALDVTCIDIAGPVRSTAFMDSKRHNKDVSTQVANRKAGVQTLFERHCRLRRNRSEECELLVVWSHIDVKSNRSPGRSRSKSARTQCCHSVCVLLTSFERRHPSSCVL